MNATQNIATNAAASANSTDHQVGHESDRALVQRLLDNVGEVLLGGNPANVAKACNQAARTLPVIVGFAVGCGIGAACEAAFGLWSLALPAGLALLAFAMGFTAEPDGGRGS